jgi:CubicO group peptidase (beta-lactamase class C family)
MKWNRRTGRGTLLGLLSIATLACSSAAANDFHAGAGQQVDPSDPSASRMMQGYPLPPERAVNLTNWLEFPYNRWAFRNMRALFPTGAIPATARVQPLTRGRPLAVENLTFRDSAGTTRSVGDYIRAEHIDGLIVLHRGRIVYEGLHSSMQGRDLHLWQSMTKSVTGLMAEILIAEGQLDPSRKAQDYLPELNGTVWGDASIRDLLDMSVNAREGSTRAADQPKDFWSKVHFLTSLRDPAVTQAGPNGDLFYYTNSAPTTVGLVMSRVTGKSWHQLAHELVWSKIGAESEANIWLDTEGQGAAAGGMSSTLRDAARFAELMRNGGRVGTEQVVSPAAIAALRQSADNSAAAAVGNVALLRVRPGMSYKSYWYQVNDGKGSLEALGIFGQHIYVNPTDAITIVQLGSFTGPAPDPKNWSGVQQAIVSALTGSASR